MDVPIDRYSIVQLATCFSSYNEIEESVGNLFCSFRVAESKKPKIFKNGRSYRPLFNCIASHLFFFKQRDRESVGNLFCSFRVAESKKPKIFKNGRSYRPLFNCIASHLFFNRWLAIQLNSGRQERPFLKIFGFLDSATRNEQKRFPTLSSISLFEEKQVASYTIEQRSIGTSIFKNFWFFGFSYAKRTKKVPNTFLYLVV